VKRAFAVIVCGVLALAACGSSPKANFYSLDGGSTPGAAADQPTYIIAIGPVVVPEAVDRPQIVTRTGANQVAINEFERWAEPVKAQIGRVVAANLTQLLNGAYVFAYPQSARAEAAHTVLLDVQRFDSIPGDSVTVEVLWTVQPPGGALRTGRSAVREAVSGKAYDALVAAHNRALGVVSRDIAAAITASR
jgi:uncharacterized lipoprotein YmbA